MSDVVIDIRTVGVETVKQAADQIADMGRVSEGLTGKLSQANRLILRQVDADRKLQATKNSLRKAVKEGVITQGQMNSAMKEAHRVAREYVATDKEAVRIAKERVKAEKKKSDEIERLRRKHDAAYRVQQEQNKLIKEYDMLLAAGHITLQEHAHLVDRATKEVKEFNAALVKGGNQFGKFDAQAYKSAQTLKRRFNQGVQQAGYQVGDFFVQIQSGTDVLVALGQQGSQLALVLGKHGPVIGAILAIGTAMATMIIQTIKATKTIKDFDDVIDGLSDSKDKLESLYDVMVAKPDEIAAKHKLAREEVLKLIQIQAQAAKMEADKAITTSVGAGEASSFVQTPIGLTSTISDLSIAERLGVEKPVHTLLGFKYTKSFSESQKGLFDEYRKAAGELKKAESEGPAAQLEALDNLLAVVEKLGGKAPDAFTTFRSELAAAQLAGSEATLALERLNAELGKVNLMSPKFKADLDALAAGDMDWKDLLPPVLPQQFDATAVQIFYDMRDAQQQVVDGAAALRKLKQDTLTDLREEGNLAVILAQHGKDSEEYQKAVADAKRKSVAERYKEEGLVGNILKIVMDEYDLQQQRLKAAEAEAKKKQVLLDLEEARIDAMGLHLDYADREKAAAQAVEDRRKEIRKAVDDANTSLNNQLLIAQTILSTNNDKEAVAQAEADIARQTYMEEKRREGVVGNLLTEHMKLYDSVVAAEKAAKDMADALEAAEKALNKLNNFSSNLDVEIAKMTAEIDALKKGKDAEAAAFIAGEKAKALAMYEVAKAAAIQANDMVRLGEIAIAITETLEKIEQAGALRTELNTLKDSMSGGSKSKSKTDAEKLQDDLQEMADRNRFLEQTLYMTGEQLALEEELYNLRQQYGPAFTSAIESQTRAMLEQTQALEKQKQVVEGLADSIANSIGNAFYDVVTGAKSVEDALREMALNIINELFRVLVVEQMVASIKRSLMGPIGGLASNFFADGGVISGGRVVPFADGGVVASPTLFPMSGGNTGLMGEAGPEAIMPLRRGSDGKLGVAASSEAAAPVVNQKIVNVLDPSIVGDFLSSRQGEKVIMNVMRRNRMA